MQDNPTDKKAKEMDPEIPDLNVLAISLFNVCDKNRIFGDYCDGLKANSKNYYYADYSELYLKLGKKAFEKYVEELVIAKKISYIFFNLSSGDLTLDIYFIERLSKRAFILMNFYDSPIFFETIDRYYAQAADLIILPDYLIKYQYDILNIKAICTFSFFNKDYYRRLENINKNIDVSFVGDVTRKKRLEYINFLRKNNISIKAYGRGSEEGFADFNKMVETFNKSKINVNFSSIINIDDLILGKKIAKRINLCNGRTIEIALCGGFVLAEYANGMERMFKIGEEIAVFHTKEELIEKIKFYLANDSQREKIAKKGYDRALRDYDATAGFSKVFEEIKETKRKDKIVYLDEEFLRNYASVRFYYMTRFLLMGRFRLFFEELRILCRLGKVSYSKAYVYILKAVSLHLDKYPAVKIKLKRYLKIPIKY